MEWLWQGSENSGWGRGSIILAWALSLWGLPWLQMGSVGTELSYRTLNLCRDTAESWRTAWCGKPTRLMPSASSSRFPFRLVAQVLINQGECRILGSSRTENEVMSHGRGNRRVGHVQTPSPPGRMYTCVWGVKNNLIRFPAWKIDKKK